MSYEIKTLQQRTIVGKKIRTTNENMQCIEDMRKLWNDFFTEKIPEKIENICSGDSYGVYSNYESDMTRPYDYTVGMEVSSGEKQDSALQTHTIPAGTYACFQGKGDLEKVVGDLWQKIWTSGLQRNYQYDFEKYGQPDQEGNHSIEICIGLQQS